mmetsp:Transcript_81213/g.230478  ORF Transcript_81213/g.230478 Transcript_81213/m.230478 type:complete len:234 (-) Transcript_81213:443-1144(-)
MAQLAEVVPPKAEHRAVLARYDAVVVAARYVHDAASLEPTNQLREWLACRVAVAQLTAVVVAERRKAPIPQHDQCVLAAVVRVDLHRPLALQLFNPQELSDALRRAVSALAVIIVASSVHLSRTGQHHRVLVTCSHVNDVLVLETFDERVGLASDRVEVGQLPVRVLPTRPDFGSLPEVASRALARTVPPLGLGVLELLQDRHHVQWCDDLVQPSCARSAGIRPASRLCLFQF